MLLLRVVKRFNWIRTHRVVILFPAGVLALVIVLFGGLICRFPPGACPVCGKQIDGALSEWMEETESTNGVYPANGYYPNTNGNGDASLALVYPYFGKGDGQGLNTYGYIPGLRADDPTNLVLMYLKKKTRFTWHDDLTATIFSPKRWKIVEPGMAGPDVEGGELVTTPEFRKRILNTLAFLKANQRPYWQTVEVEQKKFLDSIKE